MPHWEIAQGTAGGPRRALSGGAGGSLHFFFVLLGAGKEITTALCSDCTDFAHLLYGRGLNRQQCYTATSGMSSVAFRGKDAMSCRRICSLGLWVEKPAILTADART